MRRERPRVIKINSTKEKREGTKERWRKLEPGRNKKYLGKNKSCARSQRDGKGAEKK